MSMTRRDFTKAALAAGVMTATACGAVNAGERELIMRPIPATGERIPVVGLGTNRYGVDASAEARAPLKAALARFHELGGQLIDTAPMYRTSESVLGDLIAELGIRDELFVATKADRSEGGEATREQMRASLRKLNVERFDLMQVHNLRGWKSALAMMRDWKQDGRIRYIGITTSRENQYAEFEQVMRNEELDFIQVNYSLEQSESAKRLLPLAQDRGIGVIINRAFGGGRIFQAVGKQPLPDWAADFDCTSWAQFLLKYTISHPATTVVIPGMTKVRHVDDNMAAMRGRLPTPAMRQRMEAYYAAL